MAVSHLPELDVRLLLFGDRPRLALGRGREQRQRLVAQRLDRPERITAFEP